MGAATRIAAAIGLLAGLTASAPAASAPSAASQLALPTRADLHPPNLLPPLPGHFPNRIPRRDGAVELDETVTVGLDAAAAVRAITVEQTLTLTGVGDYAMEITGPATDVEPLPGSDAAPGLRNGAIIWEGFCPGRRTLRARAVIDTAVQRFTSLPVSITRSASSVGIANATTATRPIPTAEVGPGALDPALRGVARALASRRAPVPGARGVPAAIEVRGASGTRPARVIVPLRVRGMIGARAIDEVLLDQPLTVSASRDARISVTVEPVLPSASVVPRAPATAVERARALEMLQVIMWQVARVSGEGFMGLPVDIDGAIRSRVVFGPMAVPPPPPPRRTSTERPRPGPIAIASVLALAALEAARRWWTTH